MVHTFVKSWHFHKRKHVMSPIIEDLVNKVTSYFCQYKLLLTKLFLLKNVQLKILKDNLPSWHQECAMFSFQSLWSLWALVIMATNWLTMSAIQRMSKIQTERPKFERSVWQTQKNCSVCPKCLKSEQNWFCLDFRRSVWTTKQNFVQLSDVSEIRTFTVVWISDTQFASSF